LILRDIAMGKSHPIALRERVVAIVEESQVE
jgi:hypothetical protein